MTTIVVEVGVVNSLDIMGVGMTSVEWGISVISVLSVVSIVAASQAVGALKVNVFVNFAGQLGAR